MLMRAFVVLNLIYIASDPSHKIVRDPGPLPTHPPPKPWDRPEWLVRCGTAPSPGMLPQCPASGPRRTAAGHRPCSAHVGPHKPRQKPREVAAGIPAEATRNGRQPRPCCPIPGVRVNLHILYYIGFVIRTLSMRSTPLTS